MRYLSHTREERQEMLDTIGIDSVEDLFKDIYTKNKFDNFINLDTHKSEIEVERALEKIAKKNLGLDGISSFLGGGAYNHHIPATVDHLIQRSEFLTSYTPYQPEISQGTLQYLFEFQTQVCLLTGMEASNASMYDGASGCAEAVMMANRITKKNNVILSGSLHPHYRDCTTTYLQYSNAKFIHLDDYFQKDFNHFIDSIDSTISCVVIQNPCVFGSIRDLSNLSKKCNSVGALLVVVITEVISLGALKSPGAMGADIVVVEGQSLGNPLNFGGPYVGLFATKKKYLRQMPGRIVGETTDSEGNRGFVLTLSTREQHIRREKATSNICTNSGLCSLAFTIHLSLLGEDGFKKLALINHSRAIELANKLDAVDGVKVINDNFFNEFLVKLSCPADLLVEKLILKKILAGIPLMRLFPENKNFRNYLLIANTELNDEKDIEKFVTALTEILK